MNRKRPSKERSSVNYIQSPKPSKASSSGLFKRLKADLENTDSEDDSPCMMISAVNKINEPCYVEVLADRRRLTMEIDCGSAESVISESLFLRNFSAHSLKPCNKKLVVIDGKRLAILGKVFVPVQVGDINAQELSLVVLQCDNDFVPLMGRTWLDVFYKGRRNTFARPTTSTERINALTEDETIDDVKHFPRWQDRVGAQAPIESAI